MQSPQTNPGDIRMKRIVLFSLVGFFGLVTAVNGVMIWLALGTHPGVTQEHPFEVGLKYDEITAAAERQAALGWKADLEFIADEENLRSGRLIVTMSGKDGKALLEPMSMKAEISRRVRSGEDETLPLEPMGPGRYGAALVFPEHGEWVIRLYAESEKGPWQVAQPLMVSP